jgi:transposase, IS30 family
MKKKPKLSQFERDRIEALLKYGHTQKEVAEIIGRNKSTISRERERNSHKIRIKGQGWKITDYEASVAQMKAANRRTIAKYRCKKINENPQLQKYIVCGLNRGWNPDEISGRMRRENQPFYASKTAIYEWLYSSWGQAYCHLLPKKQYRPKRKKGKKTKREMIPNRIGINARPSGFKAEFGHFEHDTFVSGKKTGSKVAVSVLIEPKASYSVGTKIKNMKPKTNEQAVQKMMEDFKQKNSITRDNGIENKNHEKTEVPSFFCDPYHAVQKPHVENLIKTLRRFFSKGSDLSNYSQNQIDFAFAILNNKPRKRLGYKTPFEVMMENDMLNIESINRWEIVLANKLTKNRTKVAIEG